VLVIVTRALDARSELVVLDALALEKGPLAVVPLPLLPLAFHGDWDPVATD
jgi:carotenoid cleavage dioxygenase-like enzyme